MSAQPDQHLGLGGQDTDSQETREWLDALAAVIQSEGRERAHFPVSYTHLTLPTTPYV